MSKIQNAEVKKTVATETTDLLGTHDAESQGFQITASLFIQVIPWLEHLNSQLFSSEVSPSCSHSSEFCTLGETNLGSLSSKIKHF